jgi:hypothetical protein
MRGNPGTALPGPARSVRRCATTVALLGCLTAGAAAMSTPASAQTVQSDGSIKLSGRTVRCGSVRTVMDTNLPSEGAAAPGHLLLLNPRLLRQHTETVRLFVFYHECGHHHVGASELDADCWGVEQGVQQGWLDKKSLGEICESFDGAPETPTHPSGRRRCHNLDKCFATAVASLAAQQPAAQQQAQQQRRAAITTASTTGATTASTSGAPRSTEARNVPSPRLLHGPTLVSIGTMHPANRQGFADCAPRTAQAAARGKDPIGELIQKTTGDAATAACR